jgi:hypothetical protein
MRVLQATEPALEVELTNYTKPATLEYHGEPVPSIMCPLRMTTSNGFERALIAGARRAQTRARGRR